MKTVEIVFFAVLTIPTNYIAMINAFYPESVVSYLTTNIIHFIGYFREPLRFFLFDSKTIQTKN